MMNRGGSKTKVTIQEIALIGVMVAVIEVCKIALGFLPNIELTSFWMIMFTLFFGWRIVIVVPVFILIEGCMYGFSLWWFMYLLVWPLLVLFAWIFREKDNNIFWAILSGIFGLFFGLLCTIPYVLFYIVGGGVKNALYAGFAWWVAGIPWDIIHGVGNFVLMALLYTPIRRVMQKNYR